MVQTAALAGGAVATRPAMASTAIPPTATTRWSRLGTMRSVLSAGDGLVGGEVEDEVGHLLALHRVARPERAVREARGDAGGGHPLHLVEERVRVGHVGEQLRG